MTLRAGNVRGAALRFLLSPFAEAMTCVAILFGGMSISTARGEPVFLLIGGTLIAIGVCPLLVRGFQPSVEGNLFRIVTAQTGDTLTLLLSTVRLATELVVISPATRSRLGKNYLEDTVSRLWRTRFRGDSRVGIVLYVLSEDEQFWKPRVGVGAGISGARLPPMRVRGLSPLGWIGEITRENTEGVVRSRHRRDSELVIPLRAPDRVLGALRIMGVTANDHSKEFHVALMPYAEATEFAIVTAEHRSIESRKYTGGRS